ncbi:uncharacterized protein THITE_2115326 [Thermothielavioides terrestris NRRL 8126]|uniref:PHD-type domain-containing protein n=1 Tax=Thermothielavioides terrestris (strain ATCC 38088 / NRRL 8126) TaxID=578455 RepID=G2R400_THETT|nr:uncharacterized protein THITE_2115326 [Thermothielavioides terrestris NRRL 8126]AEO66852.1 hypothetical protein THITE_2115326 [Thermothielavioides terrestris NRRL 8126]
MARASTDSARKRTRALHEQEDASLSAKKRRLQASSDLPSAAVKVPSVANGDSKQRGRRAAAAQADSRDVPSSEDKGTTNSAHRQPERLAKGKRQAKKPQPAASTDLQKSSVYDVPDSDEDELTTAAVKPRPRRQTLGTAAAAKNEPGPSVAVNGDEHVKRKRGRPDKVDRGESATAQSSDAAPPEAGAGVSTRRAGRLGARRSPSRDLLQTEERESDGKPVQKLRRPRATTNGRTEDAPMPKGILTPRKGKPDGDRLRRSVVFDDDRGDEETPDERPAETPSRSTRKRSQADEATKTEVQEMDEGPETDQEEDDEVCAICSKPDSAPPNEIVFCDNCDMAVHQECYGLAEIPEGDWICRNCSQDDAPSANSLGPRQPHSAVAARDVQRPDIPNFEQHLRSAQRVLLDRCTGRRRIKLRGQDEAYEKAYQLIEQTVVAGEGNSMMVIGARGCGKTTLIESILADMSRLHEGQFHVVRLSGFIHTDDKLALREIWRQLGKEMEVEDELVNKAGSPDTMDERRSFADHGRLPTTPILWLRYSLSCRTPPKSPRRRTASRLGRSSSS